MAAEGSVGRAAGGSGDGVEEDAGDGPLVAIVDHPVAIDGGVVNVGAVGDHPLAVVELHGALDGCGS